MFSPKSRWLAVLPFTFLALIAGSFPSATSTWNLASNVPPTSDSGLLAISSSSAANVWTVGFGRTTSQSNPSTPPGLAWFWNGHIWTPETPAPPNAVGYSAYVLEAVATVSPTSTWVAGAYRTVQKGSTGKPLSFPLIEHWNGSAWTVQTIPSVPPGSNSQIGALAASSSNNVWAVGTTALQGAKGPTPLLLHWNGSSWTQVAIPENGAQIDCVTVSGNTVYIGGSDETTNALLMSSSDEGVTWHVYPLPTLEHPAQINSVDVGSADNVWMGGFQGNFPLILHWNGSKWISSGGVMPPGMTNGYIKGIATAPGGVVVAGGTYTDSTLDTPVLPGQKATSSSSRTIVYTPLLESWNGSEWQRDVVHGYPYGSILGVAVTGQSAWAAGIAVATSFQLEQAIMVSSSHVGVQPSSPPWGVIVIIIGVVLIGLLGLVVGLGRGKRTKTAPAGNNAVTNETPKSQTTP